MNKRGMSLTLKIVISFIIVILIAAIYFTFFYSYKCKIEVKLLQIKKGDLSFSKLEGSSMNCYVQAGSTVAPESDLSNCHGDLKEGLQETIINKLHKYIVNNLGEIGEGLKKPL